VSGLPPAIFRPDSMPPVSPSHLSGPVSSRLSLLHLAVISLYAGRGVPRGAGGRGGRGGRRGVRRARRKEYHEKKTHLFVKTFCFQETNYHTNAVISNVFT